MFWMSYFTGLVRMKNIYVFTRHFIVLLLDPSFGFGLAFFVLRLFFLAKQLPL